MKEQTQTVFLIEGLQPGWLDSPGLRRIYILGSRLSLCVIGSVAAAIIFWAGLNLVRGTENVIQRAIVEGSFGGLIMGFIVCLVEIVRMEKQKDFPPLLQGSGLWQSILYILVMGASIWISITLFFTLVFGFSNWLTRGLDFWWREGLITGVLFGLSAAIVFGMRANRNILSEDVKTVEYLRWSRDKAIRGVFYGAGWGIIVGTLFGIADRLSGRLSSFGNPIYSSGLSIILIFALIWTFFLTVIGLVFGGLERRFVKSKTIPTQGIRMSLKNSITLGLLGTIVGAITVGVIGIMLQANNNELLAYVLYGTFFGLLTALWYGGFDVVKHYTLRLILWQTNAFPWHCGAFLDYAAERIFLRKVGGGYIFVHRLLLEYFAELETGQTEKKLTPN